MKLRNHDTLDATHESTIASYSLQSTCRCCLKNAPSSELIDIFEEDALYKCTPMDILKDIVFPKPIIHHDDNLPQHICQECMSRLRDISSFRRSCVASYEVLESYFKALQIQNNKIEPAFEFINVVKVIEVCEDLNRESSAQNERHQLYNLIEPDDGFRNVDDYFEKGINDKEQTSPNPLKTKYACKLCGKTYIHQKTFTKHLRKVHRFLPDETGQQPRKRHGCKACGKFLPGNTSLAQHRLDGQCLSSVNPHCRYCKKVFKDLSKIDEHIAKMHPKNDEHLCPYCDKTFKCMNTQSRHVERHYIDSVHECLTCNKKFRTRKLLVSHQTLMHKIGLYQCEYCPETFELKCLLQKHLIKVHNDVERLNCSYCEKKFRNLTPLLYHENTHRKKLTTSEKDGLSNPMLCNICGKGFNSPRSLKQHMETHNSERTIVCALCDKGFKCEKALKGHMKSHEYGLLSENYKLEYSCSICSKGFSLPSSLNTHMKKHSEYRPFLCSTCGDGFKRDAHLKIHVNSVHLKARPHQCDLCLKSFAQKCDLDYHMNRHMAVKPYKCKYCDKRFYQPKRIVAHERSHTGEKPYSCVVCHQMFATYGGLRGHHKRKHTGLQQIAQTQNERRNNELESNISETCTSTLVKNENDYN